MIAGIVPRPSHLDDPQLSLHAELALSREPEVQDPVHEIVLLVLRVRGAAGIRSARPIRRQFPKEERRALQVPKPTDEGEHLPPRLAEFREDLEGIERVEDEEAVVKRLADALRVELEQVEPRLVRRALQLLPQRAEVEDAQVSVGVIGMVAQAFRVVDQARPALLERDVQPAGAVQGARVQDVVGERRLHRAGRAGDEDDVAFRDPASEDLVESLDVSRDSLHFSSSTMSSAAVKSSSISLPFQYSAAVTCRSGCASDVIRDGHLPRATSSAPWAANERRPIAAASIMGGHTERDKRSARSSTTAKPPRDPVRNSDAVVRALKDAWRAGRTAANPGPLAAVAGAVRPKISVARPREDSSCAVRSAYLGRISSKTIASEVARVPGFVCLFDGRGAIGTGSARTATRAKHASAMGDARFAPASDASPRNSSSYAYTGPATIRAMTATPSQNECAASNREEYRA